MAEVIIRAHNMHGFYNRLDFVSELLESSDIICIQEHWVRHGSISMFDNIFPGFTVLAHSGMSDTELHLYVRPYGGIGIVYRNNSVKLIDDYGLSMNRRVQCILIETCNKHILLFNGYFPCKGDPNYAAYVEISCAFISSVKDMVDVEQFDI